MTDQDPDEALVALQKALARWNRSARNKNAETRIKAIREIDDLLDQARVASSDMKRDIILELRNRGRKNREIADMFGYAAVSRLHQLVRGTRNSSQTPPRHDSTYWQD